MHAFGKQSPQKCLPAIFFLHREDRGQGKVNGHLKHGLARDCHLGTPSGTPLSPSRHTNVKKVTGVGGTTYEISV